MLGQDNFAIGALAFWQFIQALRKVKKDNKKNQ